MTDKQLNTILKNANVIVEDCVAVVDYKKLDLVLYARLEYEDDDFDIEYSVDKEEKLLTEKQEEQIRLHLLSAVEEYNNNNNSAFTSDDYAHFESLIFS